MTRIVVTGVSGQLGAQLLRSLQPLGDIVPISRRMMDLQDPKQIWMVLDTIQPDIIVNSAAYTQVDLAEQQSAIAFAINADAPRIMAEWVHRHKAWLIHYSTDYVFDGEQRTPYHENATANPKSVYGQSKWAGERAIQNVTDRCVILRTAWLYSTTGHNFLNTMLRLLTEKDHVQIVSDQIGTPTSAIRVANITAHLIREHMVTRQNLINLPAKLYHLTALGQASWYEYAVYILQVLQRHRPTDSQLNTAIDAILTADYPTAATRPAHSVLDCSQIIRDFRLSLPHWQEDVESTIAARLRYTYPSLELTYTASAKGGA